jgi:SAM-dependent methyltransferase
VKLRPQDVERLESFLEDVAKTVYSEPSSSLHDSLSAEVWKRVAQQCALAPGARVLDVGCGQGSALQLFRNAQLAPVGVTLSAADAEACRAADFEVHACDQSFLDFPDASFDLVWCRHCLEHSVFPLFTLRGLRRVLRPQGWLYVEVPAPDTACRHQVNPNHYSVFGRSVWIELLRRAGCRVVDTVEIRFRVDAGEDLYWGFLAHAGG